MDVFLIVIMTLKYNFYTSRLKNFGTKIISSINKPHKHKIKIKNSKIQNHTLLLSKFILDTSGLIS